MFRRLLVRCELGWNRIEKQSDHKSNNQVKIFTENIVVKEEEWFADMNLTDGATFPMALIKHENQESTKKIIFHLTQSNTDVKLQ